MTFVTHPFGEIPTLVYSPWLERGIVHGFTCRPADFSAAGLARWGQSLSQAGGGGAVALLHQVHGDNCYDVTAAYDPTAPLKEGDALAWEPAGGFRGVFGVKAADCVPILGWSSTVRFALHAGWRGLAGGLIEKIAARPGARGCEWVIGPCAGPQGYEVGQEVLDAIGSVAVYRAVSAAKAELDLARTAQSILGRAMPGAVVHVSGSNTVIDSRFHSHRRDGLSAGRGLGFFVV